MTRRYAPEIHTFLRDFVPGHTAQEVAEAVTERFGISMTAGQVKSYKHSHRLRSGTPAHVAPGRPTALYPAEVMEYIRENYKGVGPKEMTARLNAKFGTEYTVRQIDTYYGNHKFDSGLTGRFEKGHVPPNKGKKGMRVHPNAEATQFARGHAPANKMPIGAETVKGDGYLWRKIGEGSREWKQVHILIWEEANGPVPEGFVVTFKDGDRRNVDLDNLALVTMGENVIMTTKRLRSPAFAEDDVGVNIARAYSALREAKKRK